MNIKYQSIILNLDFIKHAYSQLKNKKSPIRLLHNYFLKNISIQEKTIDIGSGKHSSYLKFLEKKNVEMFFADKFNQNHDNFIEVDLEKELSIDDNEFNTVLLFNVFEHVNDYKNLINELYRILQLNGSLEIFVPFMHRYHEDPEDCFRPTHKHLTKLLENRSFEVKTEVIGVGPFTVFSEMILKYFKFTLIKMTILILFILIDKLIKLFSKDFNTFYLGTHCSCIKK